MLIAVFTTVHHLPQKWAKEMQFTPSHPVSYYSPIYSQVLQVLSLSLSLSLSTGVSPTQTLFAAFLFCLCSTCPTILGLSVNHHLMGTDTEAHHKAVLSSLLVVPPPLLSSLRPYCRTSSFFPLLWETGFNTHIKWRRRFREREYLSRQTTCS